MAEDLLEECDRILGTIIDTKEDPGQFELIQTMCPIQTNTHHTWQLPGIEEMEVLWAEICREDVGNQGRQPVAIQLDLGYSTQMAPEICGEQDGPPLSPPQGSIMNAPFLHEGEAQNLTEYLSASNVDSQNVESTRQERRNTSRGAKRTRERPTRSASGFQAKQPRKGRKKPIVFPAVADNGGSFVEFQVDPIGLEIYEPVTCTLTGRIPGSRIQPTGEEGEGKITGVRYYGHFEGGWTKDCESP